MMICTTEGAFNEVDRDFATLQEAKLFVCKQADSWGAFKRAQFLAPISPYEASSWPLKLAEAESYPDNCPNLTVEAAAREIPLADLVTKVLSKAAQLAMLEAVISGRTGKHIDTIKSLATIDDVVAYDWRFEV